MTMDAHTPQPATPVTPGSATPAPPSDRAVLEFLAWRYDRLHTLFQFAVAGLIILSLALNVFLYKQMRLVRVQLPQQRDAVIRFAMEFQKRDDATIRAFVGKLQQFAVANPDFRAVLDAYRTHLSQYFMAAPPALIQKAPAPTAATNNAKPR